MKIVFMGTPDFSVLPLKALYDAGHAMVLVLTREDKPRGRGHEMQATPVKETAIALGIPVLTPKKMRDEALVQTLRECDADVFVVVAYGKILPKEILDIPRLGCINIHASLLPEYRGAAPIQWAILDGKKKSGITTMMMDEGLDTGDILKQYEIDIEKKETAGSLFDKLAKLGARAIVDTLACLQEGKISRTPQGEMTTEYAKMLKKEDGKLDFMESAVVLERKVRGFAPWPGAYTFLGKKNLRIWQANVLSKAACSDLGIQNREQANTGEPVIAGERMFFVCGQDVLEVLELQIEGKKRMDTKSFLRGYKAN